MNKDSKKSKKRKVGNRVKLDDRSKTGRKRDWVKYKTQSLAVSEAYKIFEELAEYSNRMSNCGGWLRFISCPKGHEKRLISAIFCDLRLCCICQWRKSIIMFHQVLLLSHEHLQRYKSDIPLLLTLTVPNVSADKLSVRLDLMQKSWKKLVDRKPVKRICRSWFRGLEITYSAERDDYHPHYHVLIFVPKSYFNRSRNLYIERDRWLQMWQESTGIDEITQVDIRRVRKQRKGSSIESVSAEVAKYATKPSDYIVSTSNGLCQANSKVVEVLHYALRRKRLVAFGGEFAKIRKEKRMQDIEEVDKIHIDDIPEDCRCRVCQSELVHELYRWSLGLRAYYRQEK